MKDNIIKNKSYAFALRIVNAYQYLNKNQREFILSKQMLRGGTAVGAMVREAAFGQSKSDFIHKFKYCTKRSKRNTVLAHDFKR